MLLIFSISSEHNSTSGLSPTKKRYESHNRQAIWLAYTQDKIYEAFGKIQLPTGIRF